MARNRRPWSHEEEILLRALCRSEMTWAERERAFKHRGFDRTKTALAAMANILGCSPNSKRPRGKRRNDAYVDKIVDFVEWREEERSWQ